MADHSVAGLAKSMDAMRDACELLLRELDKNPQLQGTSILNSEKLRPNAYYSHHSIWNAMTVLYWLLKYRIDIYIFIIT